MTWNHRVIRRVRPEAMNLEAPGEPYVEFAIHEVFYDETGNPNECTEDAVAPYGTNLAELKECLELNMKALEAPVLEYDYFDSLKSL